MDCGGLGTCRTIANALLCLDYWILYMSGVDYGFNQWSVVSFVIKKKCVLICGEIVYI